MPSTGIRSTSGIRDFGTDAKLEPLKISYLISPADEPTACLQGLFSNPRDSAPVAHPASLQSQFSSMYPNAPRLQSNQSLGGFSADPSLGGQLSGVDTQGLRGKDSLYGFAEGGLPDRGEQEGYYKPPASHQVATPNLEDIFSRMNIERSPSAQGPASSVGQRRARE